METRFTGWKIIFQIKLTCKAISPHRLIQTQVTASQSINCSTAKQNGSSALLRHAKNRQDTDLSVAIAASIHSSRSDALRRCGDLDF